MKLAALQPGYFPWLGFFDQIYHADLFIIYDDLQYTRKDWRNRNRIKTSHGPMWLTVPVVSKGAHRKRICDIAIAPDRRWAARHWQALKTNYAKAPFLSQHAYFLKDLYGRPWRYLSRLNREIIDYCLDRLSIRTEVLYASDHCLEQDYLRQCEGKTDATQRIVFLCNRFGAKSFLEGASGKKYIKERVLKDAGIDFQYHDYPHPRYRQRFGPFIPYLSIVDLMFNHGDESLNILTHGAAGKRE